MGDDSPAGGRARVEFRQHRSDVFIGQAVESVALNATVGDGGRQRKCLGDRRLCPMERGVEAGDLRQTRTQPGQRADRSEIVRLMQARERHQLVELRKYGVIHEYRCRELVGTVHHAMAGGDDA